MRRALLDTPRPSCAGGVSSCRPVMIIGCALLYTLCDRVAGRNRKNVPVSRVSLAACWGPSGSPWGLQGPGPPGPRPRPADPHPAGRRILLNCERGVTHQVSEPKGKSCRSSPSQVPPGRCRKLSRRKKSSRCFFVDFFCRKKTHGSVCSNTVPVH